MKLFFKHTLLLIVLVSTSMIFEGCATMEDVYSCDPNIDKLVKTDLSSYKNIERADWLQLDESLKIPVYRTFSAEKKRDFWKAKFDNLKQLEWTKAEIEHINLLCSFIDENSHLFLDKPKKQEELNFITAFTSDWSQYATNTLKWSKQLIYDIIASGNDVNIVTPRPNRGTLLTMADDNRGSSIVATTPDLVNNTLSSDLRTGIVVEEGCEPLVGVSVTVKGTSNGVSTDINGHFAIYASIGETLSFSYVGFSTMEIPITSNSEYLGNIQMFSSSNPYGCNCNTGSDFCGFLTSDRTCLNNYGCTSSGIGCGAIWMFSCNGVCGYVTGY
jgi:hypothetical protein